MGWFNPASHLSPKALEVLKGLAESGSSESAGVADTLNTIAENGEEQATDEYLMGCALEMLGAARAVIQSLRPAAVGKMGDDNVEYLCCPTCEPKQVLCYVEDISSERKQLGVDDELALFASFYETAGWDEDCEDSYLYCGGCGRNFNLPPGVEIDFA